MSGRWYNTHGAGFPNTLATLYPTRRRTQCFLGYRPRWSLRTWRRPEGLLVASWTATAQNRPVRADGRRPTLRRLSSLRARTFVQRGGRSRPRRRRLSKSHMWSRNLSRPMGPSSHAEAARYSNAMSPQNVELARRNFELVSQGADDQVARRLASNVEWHHNIGLGTRMEGIYHGREEVLALFRTLRESFGSGSNLRRSATSPLAKFCLSGTSM
jgi:hypothetical protein